MRFYRHAALLLLSLFSRSLARLRCSVMDHGAKGDNATDDTAAFKAAISACRAGGEVIVPHIAISATSDATGGHSGGAATSAFRTNPINLTSNMALVVEAGATVVATGYRTIKLGPLPSMGGTVIAGGGIGAGLPCRFSPIISAWNATNVTLTGGGRIDGQGLGWYNYKPDICGKPLMMEFNWVTGLRINNLHIHNSPSWTINPYMSRDVHIHHVNITDDNPGNAHFNTDGIDPNSCEDVLIEDYYYCGGDDAIAIKSGWNIAGILYGKPSRNITVRRSTSGCRGGWTIGSEDSAGVEDVLFEDLVSTSESGIRISAELGRGGFVRNVTFRNLTFAWAKLEKKTFLFEVEQTYPNGGTNPPCTGCPIPKLTPKQTIPDFGPIRFERITVLSAPKGLSIGKINCSVSPCHGIEVSDVRLVDAPGATPLACTQAHGTQDGNDPSAVHAGCLTPAVPLTNV